MPAALLFRASCLRLKYCTAILPTPPCLPRRPAPPSLAARHCSSAPRDSPDNGIQTLEDDGFAQSALPWASRLSLEGTPAAGDRTSTTRGVLNRFSSNRAGWGRQLSRSQEKNGVQSNGSELQKAWLNSRSSSNSAQFPHGRTSSVPRPSRCQPSSVPARRPYKGNFISWNRVKRLDKRLIQPPNRFTTTCTGVSVEEGSPEAWTLLKKLRGMHLQWGYIRHRYPPSERLAARRAFSSWKLKLGHVLAPSNPSSWPWRDDARWLFELHSVPDMRKAWEDLDVETRRDQWPRIILSTLYRCPDKAYMVLEATLHPLPQGYAIHDVLLFIAQRLRLSSIKDFRERTIKAEEILELLVKILEDMPPSYVPFGQRTFGLFARKLPSSQTSELYAVLQRSNVKLHANTQLHFASKLASDMSHKETALGILKGLAESGCVLNAPSPSSAITTLLHCKSTHDGWSEQKQTFSPQYALEFLMERGFTPNAINSTAFLDSLCQQSEVEEAIRLALLFAESGIQLDTKTWSTVFRGAKSSLKIENVVRSFDVAKAANVPYVDVLNNALHAIFYFAEMESRERRMRAPWCLPLFGPMLRIYAKKFDLERLQWWLPDSLPLILTQTTGNDGQKFESHQQQRWELLETIVPVVEKFFSTPSDEPKLCPSSTTVAIMLRAYVKSLQQPYDLMAFYSFFKSRLEEARSSDSLATRLIKDQGSLIHDTIIMAMTERPGLSRPALQVFGDMLKDHVQSAARSDGKQSSIPAPIHPPPGICTYSILVRGLMNRGDRILAEQVVQVMREQGIEPNLVTWNTLAKAYAMMQNISKTVAALQDMEAAGLQPDLFTFKAFGKLRGQAAALEMMEGIIDVNREKLATEDMHEQWTGA